MLRMLDFYAERTNILNAFLGLVIEVLHSRSPRNASFLDRFHTGAAVKLLCFKKKIRRLPPSLWVAGLLTVIPSGLRGQSR